MLESIIREHLVDHMLMNALFSDKQYGFLIGGRSTALQLLRVFDEWTEALDQGDDIDIIYMDYRKTDTAKIQWWDNLCSDLKGASDMWPIVNKIPNGGVSAPVQPLRRIDGEYDFDDKTISDRMTAVHIHRTQAIHTTYDQNFYNEVNSYIDSTYILETSSLTD